VPKSSCLIITVSEKQCMLSKFGTACSVQPQIKLRVALLYELKKKIFYDIAFVSMVLTILLATVLWIKVLQTL